jgi:hypothetical protein
MVHMASLLRLCRVEAEDGRVDATDYIGPYCSYFTVLGPRGILVFYLGL